MPTIPAALSPIPCQRTTGVGASWARAWAVTSNSNTALIALNQTIRVRILTQSVVQIKIAVHKDNVLFYLTCVSLRKPYKRTSKLHTYSKTNQKRSINLKLYLVLHYIKLRY